MTISAPSIDPHEGSGVDRRTAGADVGEPSEHIAARRLARSYWIANVLGIFAVVLLIIPALFAYALGLLTAAGFYAVIAGHIIFSLAVLRIYRKHYDAANECCCIMTDVIQSLSRENVDLQLDVAHWKALSFTKRGGLTMVKEAAAEELSCSENKEASAAVLEFPKGV
ncbi:MAG TPA: hypothetical protein VFU31_07815 [Candidatus Binatia bacterium]|nr:hypothetical protein [Candidatus Binatia bacterium]